MQCSGRDETGNSVVAAGAATVRSSGGLIFCDRDGILVGGGCSAKLFPALSSSKGRFTFDLMNFPFFRCRSPGSDVSRTGRKVSARIEFFFENRTLIRTFTMRSTPDRLHTGFGSFLSPDTRRAREIRPHGNRQGHFVFLRNSVVLNHEVS